MRNEFLAELSSHPIWQQIIKEIKGELAVPIYNPNDQRDSTSQEDRWKFISGRKFEYDRICKILHIEDK